VTEGVSGKQRVQVTKKNPPPVFQATEGLVAGREWVTRKDPLHTSNGEGQGWLAGRKTPPSRISSGGGDEGLVGGMGGGLTKETTPPSRVSGKGGDGGGECSNTTKRDVSLFIM